jgi:hypothetical protein
MTSLAKTVRNFDVSCIYDSFSYRSCWCMLRPNEEEVLKACPITRLAWNKCSGSKRAKHNKNEGAMKLYDALRLVGPVERPVSMATQIRLINFRPRRPSSVACSRPNEGQEAEEGGR